MLGCFYMWSGAFEHPIGCCWKLFGKVWSALNVWANKSQQGWLTSFKVLFSGWTTKIIITKPHETWLSFRSWINFLGVFAGDNPADGGSTNALCGSGLSVPQGQGKNFYCKGSPKGRYVSVRIPGRQEWLTLCEVEVYSTGRLNNECIHLWYLSSYPKLSWEYSRGVDAFYSESSVQTSTDDASK